MSKFKRIIAQTVGDQRTKKDKAKDDFDQVVGNTVPKKTNDPKGGK